MANKKYEETDIQAIANAIREKTGGTEKLTLDEMATEIENLEVFSGTVGKPYIDTSQMTSFRYFFNTGSNLDFLENIDTKNAVDISYMFKGCADLREIPHLDTSRVTNMSYMFQSCIELREIPQLDTSTATNMSSMFHGCTNLNRIPQLDTSTATNMSYMFQNCTTLSTVPKLNMTNSTTLSQIFSNCPQLVNLTIEGTIKKTLSLSSSPLLTHDSLMSVINALYDYSGKTGSYTLTLGSTNLAKLTQEEQDIAVNKGWQLA